MCAVAQVKEPRGLYSKCQGCNHVRGYSRAREDEGGREKRDGCAQSPRDNGRPGGTVGLLFCHAWVSLRPRISVHPSIARNEKWPCLNVSRASQYGEQRVADAAFTADSYDGLSRLQPRE